MICPLGKALGCEGLKDGNCSVFFDEGVKLRVLKGICEFKNIRAPKIGINAPKKGKMLNPIKAAKAAAKAAGVVGDAA
jgi:phage gp45-like